MDLRGEVKSPKLLSGHRGIHSWICLNIVLFGKVHQKFGLKFANHVFSLFFYQYAKFHYTNVLSLVSRLNAISSKHISKTWCHLHYLQLTRGSAKNDSPRETSSPSPPPSKQVPAWKYIRRDVHCSLMIMQQLTTTSHSSLQQPKHTQQFTTAT